MKNYLELVPHYTKVHRKQNRMSILCIILSVFLVATIFGMADMYVRSMIMKTKQDDGNWHIMLKNISDETAAMIAARPEVKAFSCYGVLNYRLDMDYTIAGKDTVICGVDSPYVTDIYAGLISQGAFPQSDNEILVTSNIHKEQGVDLGDQISICDAKGTKTSYRISGFIENPSMVLRKDVYGIVMNTKAFRSFFPNVTNGEPDDYDSVFIVQFHGQRYLRKIINDIKTQFSLSEEQVGEQAMLLGLLGQSDEGNLFMVTVYSAAMLLSILVLVAGILMIASSLNSNIAGRTTFFGMLRCIGATPKQIIRLVHREALGLCGFAIPAALTASMAMIWILCALLRFLSPKYFDTMPAFAVSLPSILAGVLIGLLTVLIASRAPARKASGVSPLTAVNGPADDSTSVRRAANTVLCRVDTALGIHHAKANRKNFLLVTASFALSIILFLSFSTTVDFMKHAINVLHPWTPDLSVISPDNACTLDPALLAELSGHPSVKRVYGRMFAYDLPVTVNGSTTTAMLVSYDETQFKWGEKYLIDGSVSDARDNPGTGLIAPPQYNTASEIKNGDVVTLTTQNGTQRIKIVGTVSECPFNTKSGEIILCSEDTFRQLTGISNYTIIDIQLKHGATDEDVETLRMIADTDCTFSDRRADNQNVLGAGYAFHLFIYGFLFLIALVTVCNIVNCVAMSVEARKKQYGGLRAIGLSVRQLTRMVIAETLTYAVSGGLFGIAIGLALNKKLFTMLVTTRWHEVWSFPALELCVILCVMGLSVFLALKYPLKSLREMSIIDTISGY
ncbi:MAG: FtsX-like permease family protein [Lachnospiraceae bacterium]|nr:FtsX-like permease family protein [Lachnospiraceae bacterium]